MKKTSLIFVLVLMLLLFSLQPGNEYFVNSIVNEHDFNTEYNEPEESIYLGYSALRENYHATITPNEILSLTDSKIISFNTALDLYNFSQDLSYHNNTLSLETKQTLASLSYTLGADIDYGTMKSRRFMPVGYLVEDDHLVFTGNFDGRGFEIENLYFESFERFSYEKEEQLHVLSVHFSMFTENEGTIKNIGLYNPIIDLENEHFNLIGFSYLVGNNTSSGIVENVYVIDDRPVTEGGISALATRVSEINQKVAASIIVENNGIFRNSYFSGLNIVNITYINAIVAEPLVFYDEGQSADLVYEDKYLLVVNVGNTHVIIKNPSHGFKETTANLRAGSRYLDNSIWYYYRDDTYPKTWGLNKNNDGFLAINNARDFISFSKLVGYNSIFDGEPYRNQNYILNNDINFDDVSPHSFQTIEIEFSGKLTGKVTNHKNPQINNLTITEGIADGANYYLGMFAKLRGVIENITLYNYKIDLVEKHSLFNLNYYVGGIAGVLNDGTIKNIILNSKIDLEHNQIGNYSIGSLVGEASGRVEDILHDASSYVKVGQQDYTSSTRLDKDFYLGGVIGRTGARKLSIYNVLNEGTITSTAGTIYTNDNQVDMHIGGIIGYVANNANHENDLGFLTNCGIIRIPNSSSTSLTNYIGGIIGLSTGRMYAFSNRYGRFSSEGAIDLTPTNNSTYLAGIVNSRHNNDVEFVQIYANNELNLDRPNYSFASLVNHLGSGNITVSQAESNGKFIVDTVKSTGIGINVLNENVHLTLNYVVINNDFDIELTSNTTLDNLHCAGVTLHENTNYLNVVYGGTIKSSNLNTDKVLWIAGISPLLKNGKKAKNVLNDGNINLNINSSANLYVAGLFNRNISGDLHNQDTSKRPVTTLGIINCFNNADIDIDKTGQGNTFVGGIVTMNGYSTGGSIQDVVNTGDILVTNSTNGNASFSSQDTTGGIVDDYYKSGIIIGGVTATVLNGKSRIYDTSNSGHIVGIASHFVRSGGILGEALWQELLYGNIPSAYYERSDSHPTDAIRISILSNGINYGDVQAITQNIATYSSSNATATVQYHDFSPSLNRESFNTRQSTNQRPGIYSSAGGVIGYGLSTMNRMINHGNISATDVAGGIVGATMAYNASSSDGTTIIVNINTAINYGKIRAIKKANYNNILSNRGIRSSDFYANNEFIYPSSPRDNNDIRRFPEDKRGFGGVFGRLQRATSQYMSSVGGSFDFVVNMDSDIDLIGRLDQVNDYTSSMRFFIFTDTKYYSAKPSDTTQAVFTGVIYGQNHATHRIHYNNETEYYKISTYRREGFLIWYTYYRDTTVYVKNPDRVATEYGPRKHKVGNTNRDYTDIIYSYDDITHSYTDTITEAEYNNRHIDEGQKIPMGDMPLEVPGSNSNVFVRVKEVPLISESSEYKEAEYVYGEDFVMRDPNTILTNGEPITSYIYYAENRLLSDTFRATRPNGMYVLASSSGSEYGSILPRNLNIINHRKLLDGIPNNLDYTRVIDDYLDEDDEAYINLVEEYSKLYQTVVNDKSALLENNQRIVLEDKNNNSINIVYEDENFSDREIIFDVNLNTLGSNRFLDPQFVEALIPDNALIARGVNSGESLETLQGLLLEFVLNNPDEKFATGSLSPDLSIDLSGYYDEGQIVEVGTFVSYSEAAVNDVAFTNYYSTTYTVKFRISKKELPNPVINGSRVDSTDTEFSNVASGYNREDITSSLGLRFIDEHNKFPLGFTLKDLVDLYYLDDHTQVKVDSKYYELVHGPKSRMTFSLDILFSDKLRKGQYYFKYQFFTDDDVKTFTIDYEPKRDHNILSFIPYTGTYFNGTSSDVAFDYDLFTEKGTGFTEIIDTSIPNYLDNKSYEIDFLSDYLATPFFDITNITVSTNIIDKYYVYTVNITGDGTTKTIVINERRLEPEFYNQGRLISSQDFQNTVKATTTARREAKLTQFDLDYRFYTQSLYNQEDFSITYTYNNGYTEYTVTDNSEFIYCNIDNYVTLYMDEFAEPGNYLIRIFYYRNNTEIAAGILEVEKLEGTSAYLTNIKFSEFVSGIEYPNIRALQPQSDITDLVEYPSYIYEPDVYYAGIDYDGADEDFVRNFKIDGQVAGIPLNMYMPHDILKYLPEGAKIKRKIYLSNDKNNYEWTPLVDRNSPQSEIDMLHADFTVNQLTLDFEEEDVYVEYMVVSESDYNNGYFNDGVLYFISVVDIKYSFQAVFDIQYYDGSTLRHVNDVQRFNEELVLITLNNYIVRKDGVTLNDDLFVNDVISEFPDFDNIELRQSYVSMYHYIDARNDGNYLYNFGSNFSGYYQFKLELPPGYNYRIYLNNYDEENLLPRFETKVSTLDGYYYYINASPRTRTKYFQIVIYDDEIGEDWGLTDYNNSYRKA